MCICVQLCVCKCASNFWYMYKPGSVQENGTYKVILDFEVQRNHQIQARIPDLVIINRKKRICYLVDFAVQAGRRVKVKESEKIDKYQDLAKESKKAVGHEGKGGINSRLSSWNGFQISKNKTEWTGDQRMTPALLKYTRILRSVLKIWGDLQSLRL